MSLAWSPVYLALWVAAAAGPQESFLGLHTALPNVFREDDDFDFDDDRTARAGLEVNFVVENSPAHQAGLQVGDVLLRFNGQQPRSPGHLESMVAALPVGSEVTMEVLRGPRILRMSTRTVLRLVPREAPTVQSYVERRRMGVVVEDVVWRSGAAPDVVDAPRGSAAQGVRVRRFLKGGIGLDAGLESADVILAVGGETVYGGEDFLVLAGELEPGTNVDFLVLRGGVRRHVTAETRDPGSHVSKFFFPLIVDYERDLDRDRVSFGLLPFNLIKYERLENRRTYCFLWFICLSTGSNEELEAVE